MKKRILSFGICFFFGLLLINPINLCMGKDLEGRVICIDPGHQLNADSTPEPIGPGSTTEKPCVSSGTSGAVAGPEHGVNLDVGLKLRDVLEAQGITVVMTRTIANVELCNSERAAIANESHADLAIRLHCNSGTSHSCFTLYPANIAGWTDDIYEESLKAAQIVQNAFSAYTGIPNGGLSMRSDISGFNWSDVPVILPEMLHMQNTADDILAASPDFRQVMAEGMADGIVQYLETLPPITALPSWKTY